MKTIYKQSNLGLAAVFILFFCILNISPVSAESLYGRGAYDTQPYSQSTNTSNVGSGGTNTTAKKENNSSTTDTALIQESTEEETIYSNSDTPYESSEKVASLKTKQADSSIWQIIAGIAVTLIAFFVLFLVVKSRRKNQQDEFTTMY